MATCYQIDAETPTGQCGVLITTYHMVTFSGKRSVRGEELIKQVKLLLMYER